MFLFKFLQRSFSKSPLRTGGGGIDAVMPFIYISDTSSVFTICELLRRSAWCGRGKKWRRFNALAGLFIFIDICHYQTRVCLRCTSPEFHLCYLTQIIQMWVCYNT